MMSLLMAAAAASEGSTELVLITLDREDIGGRRTAWVRVPPGPGPWRVMLAFHGGQRPNRGRQMELRVRGSYTDDLMVVYPDGKPWKRGGPAWAGPGHAEGELASRDVNFARALVDEVDRRWDIDRTKVYAAGFSNGGFLTDTLWCQASDVFAGFLVVARALPKPLMDQCQPATPRPVMFVVGTEDPTLREEHQLSVPDTVEFYRDKLQCQADPPEGLPAYGPAATRFWTRCAHGGALAFREISGLEHAWPSGDDRSGGFDAAPEFLAFVKSVEVTPRGPAERAPAATEPTPAP